MGGTFCLVLNKIPTGHHTILLPARKKPPTVDRLVRTIACNRRRAHFRKFINALMLNSNTLSISTVTAYLLMITFHFTAIGVKESNRITAHNSAIPQ